MIATLIRTDRRDLGRWPRSRAQDYAAKQALILQNAARLFAEFGYVGTSIAMITDACNVSKALLYHYYPDKESILFDLISTHLKDLLTVVEAAMATAPANDRLCAISAALLEAYRDADAQHKVQIANLKFLAPAKQETLRDLERRLVTLFSETIAVEASEIGRGPLLKPVTMSLFGMLNWHYLWFREGRGISRADYARFATTMVISGAGPGAAALGQIDPASGRHRTSRAGPARDRGRPAMTAASNPAATPADSDRAPELAPILAHLNAGPSRTWSVIITLFGDAIVPRGGAIWLGTLLAIFRALDIGDGVVRTAMSRLTAGSLAGAYQGRPATAIIGWVATPEMNSPRRLTRSTRAGRRPGQAVST